MTGRSTRRCNRRRYRCNRHSAEYAAGVRALIVFMIACSSGNSSAPKPQPPPTAPASQNEETFTGTITQIDFGCAADARCSMTVDTTKVVHFGHDSRGQTPAEWGNSDAVMELMGEPQQGVGKRVEVFAAKQDGGYTLRGKGAYY